MLVNFGRGASVIPVSQVQAASTRPGIETPVPYGQIAGLDAMPAPLVGASNPEIMEMVVLLPAPLGPSRLNISPV